MALQRHSEGKFDSVTRTKTVKDLATEFETEDGCTLFLQSLMNLFVDEPSSPNSDQSQTTDDDSEIDSVEAKLRVQKQIMKFLAVQGLFVASLGTEVTSFELQETFKWPKTATPTDLCRMCIEQLQLLLSNSQKMETPLSDDDPVSYFMNFLSTLQSIPSVSHFRSLVEADEKAVKELQETETFSIWQERKYGLSAEANKYHALRHLVVQFLLQIFLHPGEFSEAASELSVCCDKAWISSSLDLLESNGCPCGEGEGDGEEEEEPAVFKCFCQDVTNDGLLRMLRVIKKDLKPARYQEDQDSEDLDDDDEDCLAIEEDEEMGETGESDEHVDDSETVDREVPESSEEDDDDDGMDDDAVFRMDTDLAQIFKEKKKNQAGGKTSQSQLVLFKLRVLSLLEIYLQENPENPQVITVYLNLAQALVNPSTAESRQQLLQRIWGIIQKKIFKAKELFNDESMQLSALASLLEKNLKLAAKPFKSKKKSGVDHSKKKQSAAWNRHKMIASLAQHSTYWKVLDVFRSVLVGYFDSKKSQIKVDFLVEVFRRRPWIAHKLFVFLVDKSVNPKVEFRRVEALELISVALRSFVPISKETRLESEEKNEYSLGETESFG
ncbi:hypothetical protein Bca52824_029741 [Brassica carinata]|uniref:Uncharacterized protein n=1 Tax=Brassica carinata TaxID=52824 RepID=A0A8X7S9A8_BRACI|nr:hypothetical protein Bca52824_029741 [Brassica carinata]